MLRPMSAPEPPLRGTRVLSVGHTLPGLYCCAMLRDLGAEIVRIERLASGSGGAGPYSALLGRFPMRSVNAGTSECRLHPRDPPGRDVLPRLAERSDPVPGGFPPRVAR